MTRLAVQVGDTVTVVHGPDVLRIQRVRSVGQRRVVLDDGSCWRRSDGHAWSSTAFQPARIRPTVDHDHRAIAHAKAKRRVLAVSVALDAQRSRVAEDEAAMAHVEALATFFEVS